MIGLLDGLMVKRGTDSKPAIKQSNHQTIAILN